MNHEQVIQEVLDAEARRRVALINEDYAEVARLFTDDLLYVHTSGLMQDKAQYLAHAQNVVRYLDVERDQLRVRVYGDDIAVMTGFLVSTLQRRDEEKPMKAQGFVTQVWIRGENGWSISSFHGSRLAN